MRKKGNAVVRLFEHLDFEGFGSSPMEFSFDNKRLTDEDKDTMKHIRIDVRTGRIFDDREERRN